MKKITFLFSMFSLTLLFSSLQAQETCTSDGTKIYYTSNAGWTDSEFYKIIDIDAENLNASTLAAHSGADGSATSTVFSTGVFTTPVYKWNETTSAFEATSKNWPVNFYMACQAPTFFTSAKTKFDINPANTNAAYTDGCYGNFNTVKSSPIWTKRGFVELSRQASAVANTAPSLHGYIQINDLPRVERVQWTYSSTAWKRGVKLDIKYNDGPWESLRWVASDIAASIGGFSEQGYGFEEIIGKQNDETSKISLRWRIWDGDSIHVNPVNVAGATFSTVNTPYAQKQVARIHQIKIFSGVDAPEAPSAVKSIVADAVKITLSNKNILLSEMAKVEIYSYDGRKLYNATTNKINVSNFQKGLYIVKAIGTSGKSQRKIVL